MTEQEKQEWDELYRYVKKEILQYDETQSIPSNLILRLKGLTTGKYIENKSIPDRAKYSYKIVLYTFQICKASILRGIAGKEFCNEMAKFNYICKIVESNLNDVYLRTQRANQAQTAISHQDTAVLSNRGSSYKGSATKEVNKRLEGLW